MAKQIRYNLEFDETEHPAYIELYIWRNYKHCQKLGGELLERWEHMKNAIQLLFPEEFVIQKDAYSYTSRGYIWNKWMDRRCKSFMNGDREFQTWWGASATGKSTDAGVLALCAWLASPHNTTVIVCSTTSKMLEKRIWREVVRFYKMREHELPGVLRRSTTSILFDPDNPLSGIHGVAVQMGTQADALGNLIGMHNEYVYLIVDEMQATREAAVTAWDNLSSGLVEGGFLGMGNPMSKMDPLGAKSIPVGGWEKLSSELEEWQTPKGYCLYFDGLKSPGVDNPEKYPFLLTQKQINEMKVDPGEDSPRFWTMRRGFLPPDGIIWAILSERAISEYHIKDTVIWAQEPNIVVGIDPAYSAGGDKCILYPAKVGIANDGDYKIEFQHPVRINLVAREDELMLDTLCTDIKNHIYSLDVPVNHIGMDCTGNQWMLADALEKSLGETGIMRVKFSGSASDDPISLQDKRPGKDLYSNYVTELWGRFGLYATNDMIRNLDDTACKQFCTRLLDFSSNDSRKVTIESKSILRERLGFSPDEADAAVVALEVVRKELNILPMQNKGGLGFHSKDDYEEFAELEEDMMREDGFISEYDLEEDIDYNV